MAKGVDSVLSVGRAWSPSCWGGLSSEGGHGGPRGRCQGPCASGSFVPMCLPTPALTSATGGQGAAGLHTNPPPGMPGQGTGVGVWWACAPEQAGGDSWWRPVWGGKLPPEGTADCPPSQAGHGPDFPVALSGEGRPSGAHPDSRPPLTRALGGSLSLTPSCRRGRLSCGLQRGGKGLLPSAFTEPMPWRNS